MEPYEEPEIEVIAFEQDDIIITSEDGGIQFPVGP